MGVKKQDILELLSSKPKQEFSFDELVEVFKITTKARKKLLPHIQSLVNTGSIKKTEKGLYIFVEEKDRKPKKPSIKKTTAHIVVGRFVKTPVGFGFVVSPEEEQDVYIDKHEVLWNGIMHGDVIKIEKKRQKGGKVNGSFIEFISRRDSKVIGRLIDYFGSLAVEVRNTGDIIMVQHGRLNRARKGDWVELEIKKWPQKRTLPYGEVVKIIDQDPYIVINEYGLRDEFSSKVLAMTNDIKEPPQEDELYNNEFITDDSGIKRKNLSKTDIVTIDGADARDFDDAVYCEKDSKGYRLFVSIADVSHYVRVNSLIDDEALQRTSSVYFPDRAIPMLPEKLSNEVCCLKPQKYRYTMTAEILFDHKGSVIKSKIYPSVIKSHMRLTYEQAQEMIDSKHPLMQNMYELYLLLRKKSINRGTVFLDIPEPVFTMDAKGNVTAISKRPVYASHSLIEEFMIAANIQAARLMKSKGMGIFRAHQAPDAEKLKEYAELAMEYKVKFDPSWNRAKQISDYLKKIQKNPARSLLNRSLLRSLKKATYSESKEQGHFALALKDYSHFTSPIRRYPDLMVHRLIKTKGLYKEEDLKRIAELCTQGEIRAMEAERSINKIKQARYMQDKIGNSFKGEISGINDRGLYIELKDVFIEGFLVFSRVSYESLIFDRSKMAVLGKGKKPRFKLGDLINVVLIDVDVFKGEIEFGIRDHT